MSVRHVIFNRRVLAAAALVAGLLAVAFWPRTMPVDVATVAKGPLLVTIDEEGRTRVRDRFVVAAPVAGRALRIELDAGDPVKRGQVIARLRPEPPPLLDARSRAEAQAAVDSARAVEGRARAEEQRSRAALDQARRELGRTRELAAGELTTRRELDAREAEVRVAEETLSAATFASRAATSEVTRALARLAPAPPESGRVVEVTAPIDGVVLKLVRESESVVPAGDPLVEIGDPGRLEIVADLLSTDAVQVRPGARVLVEQWGGSGTLEARVRRVEPSGFTKISALGVEEQRVNVVLDFIDPDGGWHALGDGFRVEVRIVTWESPGVLKIPMGALFRVGDEWAVYTIRAGRARRALVTIGRQTGAEAEVSGGLDEGARVILHPGDTLVDGARVAERPR